MNLRSIDLNLLVILDALLNEKQVTRAGRKIGLTQPAVSNALSRLRYVFKDDILVRGTIGMELTPRAKTLVGPIRQILQQVEALFAAEHEFDPHLSERHFMLRMSDLTELLILPTLSRTVRQLAPCVRLNVMHLSPPETVDALEAGTIDMALSTGLNHRGTLRSQVALRDRMVCVQGRWHPDADKPLTLERFVSLDFLNVTTNPIDNSIVDNRLAEMHCPRRVVLNVPHWLVVPHMLNALPVAVIMSERHALSLADDRLVIRELPLALEPLTWSVYWHRRHDASAAHTWLRARITEAAASLDACRTLVEALDIG